MALSNKFFNSDYCCCPPNSGCCCPEINAGSFNLQYSTYSACAGFNNRTGCLFRGSPLENCTVFDTFPNFVEDCATGINFRMRLECWSLTERTGYPPTDQDVIPPEAIEYGYRLCLSLSNSACTGVPIKGDLSYDANTAIDSGCYKPIKNAETYPKCDPLDIVFEVNLPYNKPGQTACGCCVEGDTMQVFITSGTC